MYCPKCNSEIPDGVIICPVCNAPLGAKRVTPTPDVTGVSHVTGHASPEDAFTESTVVVETVEAAGTDAPAPAPHEAWYGEPQPVPSEVVYGEPQPVPAEAYGEPQPAPVEPAPAAEAPVSAGWEAERLSVDTPSAGSTDGIVSREFEEFHPVFASHSAETLEPVPVVLSESFRIDEPEPEPEPATVQPKPVAAQPMVATHCIACGNLLEPGAEFCIYCGHKVEPMDEPVPPAASEPAAPAVLRCPRCGFENEPNVNFCISCGMKLV